MKKFKAILFDCDGTLIDTTDLVIHAWQAMGRKLLGGGLLQKSDVIKYFGRTLEEATVILAKERGISDYDLDYLHDVYWDYQNNHHEEIAGFYPGLKEALTELKARGIKLGVVTSGTSAGVLKELSENDAEGIFDAVVGCEDVTKPKPDPEPVLICCSRLGVDPSDALMVGDSRNDIASGNLAGCMTALVSWYECPMDNLLDYEKADFMLEKSEDLLELV